MQYDICLKCSSRAVLIASLAQFGLTAADEAGNVTLATASHDHALAYAGKVVSTPAVIDPETGDVTAEATYLDGEYAVLRAEESLLEQIMAATMDDVEVMGTPPPGCPTFGGWSAMPAGPTLLDLKTAACSRIDAECAKRRTAGVLVQFPDSPGVVQTRDEIDLINVTGVSSAGLAATVAGTMPPLYFRDEANIDHHLTPTQAVDFGARVMQRLQSITQAAHKAKDDIRADTVTTAGQVLAIELGVVWP